MSDDSWRSIWCAGLSSLSHSSNQTNQKDQIDEMNQLPVTRREMLDCKTLILGLKSPRHRQEKISDPLSVPQLGESEQALLPIEEESLEVVETCQTLYSEEIRITSDLAEGEAVEAFDAETNGALLEEPVEQS